MIAIEPNGPMREAARAARPRRMARRDRDQDRIARCERRSAVACQAFHWFANAEAMKNAAYRAPPRGVLQYERDERDALRGVRRRRAIVRNRRTEALRRAALATFGAFPDARVTQSEFPSRSRSTSTGCSAAPRRRRTCRPPARKASASAPTCAALRSVSNRRLHRAGDGYLRAARRLVT